MADKETEQFPAEFIGSTMKIFTITVCLIAAAAGPGFALTLGSGSKTCPVCLEEVGYNTEISATVFDTRLDFKPVGMVMAPDALPDCPKCGFVNFISSGTARELAGYRAITASEEYRSRLGRSSYFRLAYLYEKLGRSGWDVGGTYLEASWQEEQQPEKLKEDLELALKHFDAHLPGFKEGSGDWLSVQLMRVELLRRLSRFDEAKKTLRSMRGQSFLKGSLGARVLKCERLLCRLEDPAPRAIGEMEKEFGLFGTIKNFFKGLL